MTDRSVTTQVWFVGLLLCVVTTAIYLPVTRHQFINYDDPVYVTENPHVLSGLSLESVTWAFKTGRSGNWHPVTWLSLMLDSELYGDWAGGFHLTNLLLHVANTLLLFILLHTTTGTVWRSGFVSALFALHPLHVESVAWVAERKDVLSTFFGLLALITYVRYAKAAPAQHSIRRKFYLLTIAFFSLGLMSKAMLVTWPFVMLLLDFWPLQRIKFKRHTYTVCSNGEETTPTENARGDTAYGHFKKLLLEKVPFFVLSAVISVVTLLTQSQTDAIASPRLLQFTNRLAHVPVAYMRYIGKTLWPDNLAVFYPYKIIGFDSATPYVAGLALLAITIAVVTRAHRQPYLLMGWFWFLGTLVPVIGLIQVGRQSIADRYTYIPLIGIFIMAAWGGQQIARHLPRLRLALSLGATALVIAAAVVTRHQLRHWENSKLLFEQALRVTQQNEVAHNNLGAALMVEGDLKNARRHFESALRINPRHQWARMNLGAIQVQTGEIEEGTAKLRQLVAEWPTAIAYHTLATALLDTGNYAEAADYLRLAVQLQPDSFNARMNLGTALTHLHRVQDALPHFIAAAKLRPDHPDAQFNLGAASAALGKLDLAGTALLKCLRLRPQDAKARRLLADVMLKQQNINGAITNLAELVKLEPNPNTAFDLAQLLVQTGKAEIAISYYRIALELKPDWPQAYNNLALILATHPDERVRNGPEAVALAERACALTQSSVPVYLSTLAAAYAELGRFDDAIRTAEQAVALAEARGLTNIARRNTELLQLYQAGKPFHDQSLSYGTAMR